MKAILVTGIGGVVGQGILRNLRAMALGVRIVGTNTSAVSAGNHLCDSVHVVPYAYDPAFVPVMQKIIEHDGIDLIIPSTDYEAYYLALHERALGTTVAAAPAEVTGFCLDKYLNHQRFRALGIPFAASRLPSEYRQDFARTVVKPREGRGSRNIHVDPPKPGDFSDDYVVQEYLQGEELTTTFYVLRSGKLHGLITLSRELEQGNTARCEVVQQHDEELRVLVGGMIRAFPFRGSCNVQSRATERGIVPFEINCRISGTNSVRAQFGFPDVAWTVQEYMLDEVPELPHLTMGCAVRIMLDVIYPGMALADIRDRHDPHRIF